MCQMNTMKTINNWNTHKLSETSDQEAWAMIAIINLESNHRDIEQVYEREFRERRMSVWVNKRAEWTKPTNFFSFLFDFILEKCLKIVNTFCIGLFLSDSRLFYFIFHSSKVYIVFPTHTHTHNSQSTMNTCELYVFVRLCIMWQCEHVIFFYFFFSFMTLVED